MKAMEVIEQIMRDTETSKSELAEFADVGSLSNLSQMFNRADIEFDGRC